MSKGLSAGKSIFIEAGTVEPKYREELDAVIDNVRAIHGENFVNHVKFFMNFNSLLSLIMQNTTLNDDCDPDEMTKLVSKIADQLVGSHAEAMGLDDSNETQTAAVNTVNTLQGIVKEIEKDMNKRRRKSH